MASVAAYSYDHPRRIRAFPTSADKRKSDINEESGIPSMAVRRMEESLSRLEYNLNEKISILFSRMDKCSDLSVASSRAVAALSGRFDELKVATEGKVSAMNEALNELKSTMNRVCSESQNLTMTALEDCCSELVKQIKANTENIKRCAESTGKLESELRSFEKENNDEMRLVKAELHSVSSQAGEMTQVLSDELRLLAEESVNACFADIHSKVSHDLESFDMDWKDYRESIEQKLQGLERKIGGWDQATETRCEDLRIALEGRINASSSSIRKDIENKISEVHIPGLLSKNRTDLEAGLEEVRKQIVHVPVSVYDNIASEVEQVKNVMASFSANTVPCMYRDVEMRIAQCEHHTQQVSLELLKEFATEFEFDIDRMVELVHSVYVQGNMAMPPGTSGSWRRFKEVMFDKEHFGGVRVRRPILDVSSHRSRRSPHRSS